MLIITWVLAVGVAKVEQALPFFKSALEVNQTIAQFWLSYIDALIKLDRTEDAKGVFAQSQSKGLQGEGFDQLEQRLFRAFKHCWKRNSVMARYIKKL